MSNTITVNGRLGDDAALKLTPSGAAVLEFSVADDQSRKDDRGEWHKTRETMWHRCSMWGPMAEALANAGIATKGAKVTVTGAQTLRRYESASGGGVSLDLKVTAVSFEPKPSGAAQTSGNTSRGAAPAEPADDPWAPSQPQQGGAADAPPF